MSHNIDTTTLRKAHDSNTLLDDTEIDRILAKLHPVVRFQFSGVYCHSFVTHWSTLDQIELNCVLMLN